MPVRTRGDRIARALIGALAVGTIALAAPAVAPGATYVGMGDSYSAGTGTQSSYGTCERTQHAYPVLIDPQIPGTLQHVACGGAQTSNIINSGQSGEPAQAFASGVAADTDYITITIGGNDAGFSSVLIECGQPGWASDCDGAINNAQNIINNTLPGRLNNVFNTIRQRAPNARVGVITYPRIFPANGNDCSAATFFSSGEMTRLNQTADLMASVARAQTRGRPGFTFINAIPAFLGHAWCENEWINGLSNPTNNSYHPNQAGHVGYAGVSRAAMLAAPGPGQVNGPNGRIAFFSNRDGNDEVYVINGNGDFPVNLTNHAASDRDPAFSPDGTKIAFVSNRDGDDEIYTMDATGGGVTKLTSNTVQEIEPTWSPDGEFIAFRSARDGNNEIYRMLANGGSQTRLTSNTVSDSGPDWSPDGAEIVWERSGEIYKMNADGQGQTNISNNAAADTQPEFAPNNQTIAFQSNRDGDYEIFTMSETGSSVTQRTSNTAFNDQRPTWSPNGASIAFHSNRDGNEELYTMTSTGGSQTRRTNNAASDIYPSWQGDAAPPQTTIDSGPQGLTNDSTPTFEFSSSELGSSFQCSIDGGSFSGCASPFTTATLSEGEHTLRVRATDPSGNQDSTPDSRSFTVDTVPGATTLESGPSGPTADASPSFTFSHDDPLATFACSLNGAGPEPCTSPKTYTDLDDGDYTFTVLGSDSAGNPDPAPASVDFTVDTTDPETTIDFAPSELTNKSTASIEFSSNEPTATFECSLDGAAFAQCASPYETGELEDGEHTFAVVAVDAAGNTDADPATATFTIDTEAPETTLDSGPSSPTGDTTPEFSFSSADDEAGFECRIDSSEEEGWMPCESPFTSPELIDGEHRFEVRAIDEAGNPDLTPAELVFSVDATAPETEITSGPNEGALVNQSSVTFNFTSPDDPDPLFECRLDSEEESGWVPCDSTFETGPLIEGEHTFEVRAMDSFDNRDATPESRTFTVDTIAPEATIVSGPDALTNSPNADFSFSSDDPGADFECRLDSGLESAFAACDSPEAFSGLDDGAHSFEIRATDEAGNTGAIDSHGWTIDTLAPQMTIEAGPPSLTNSDQASLSFSSNEPGASLFCRIDSAEEAAFQPCTSPKAYQDLDDGTHSFDVRATDLAGNTGPPDSHGWTVDTTQPVAVIVSGPPSTTDDRTPSFEFASNEPGSSFRCRIWPADYQTCTSPWTSPSLSNASYVFDVRATDAAGNEGQTASHAFTVAAASAPKPRQGACATVRRGSKRRDVLTGTPLGDRLLGLAGKDRIRALAGDDCLLGGPGSDLLIGGPGADKLIGGAGGDKLKARDGERDLVKCGKGRDVAMVDAKDVARGCEVLRRG